MRDCFLGREINHTIVGEINLVELGGICDDVVRCKSAIDIERTCPTRKGDVGIRSRSIVCGISIVVATVQTGAIWSSYSGTLNSEGKDIRGGIGDSGKVKANLHELGHGIVQLRLILSGDMVVGIIAGDVQKPEFPIAGGVSWEGDGLLGSN